MAVVYARDTIYVAWSAGRTMLRKDDAWDADSDLVRERPELFIEEPKKLRGRPVGAPRVERATRAPGEVRTVRPRKAAAPKVDDE